MKREFVNVIFNFKITPYYFKILHLRPRLIWTEKLGHEFSPVLKKCARYSLHCFKLMLKERPFISIDKFIFYLNDPEN